MKCDICGKELILCKDCLTVAKWKAKPVKKAEEKPKKAKAKRKYHRKAKAATPPTKPTREDLLKRAGEIRKKTHCTYYESMKAASKEFEEKTGVKAWKLNRRYRTAKDKAEENFAPIPGAAEKDFDEGDD